MQIFRRRVTATHGTVWGELTGEDYAPPVEFADRTLAAYSAGAVKTAYVEPVAVGQMLRDMPLFLTPDEGYIEVPWKRPIWPRTRQCPSSTAIFWTPTIPVDPRSPGGYVPGLRRTGSANGGVEQCHGYYCWPRSSGIAAG